MSSFTTRVELHTATYADYEVLHSRMRGEDFSRFITSDVGSTYHLPMAEYDISGNLSCSDVLERAKRAVKATGKTGAILVTETINRMWSNLPLK